MKISHAIWSVIRTNKCSERKFGLTSFCLTIWLLLAGETLFGQSAIQINGMDVTIGAEEESGDSSAPYVIFSNLGPKNNAYDTTAPFPLPIVGRKVNQTPEEWIAIRFVPKVDVQATKIEAAVGWEDGKKLVQLGIYTNDDTFQTPGTLLPGGQGSTNDIPNLGECCGLTKVTLPDPGVTLTAGTIYWLVCSTDEMYGTSFNGGWQVSPSAATAAAGPPPPWFRNPGQWPAARISGTKLQTLGPVGTEKQGNTALVYCEINKLKKIGSAAMKLDVDHWKTCCCNRSHRAGTSQAAFDGLSAKIQPARCLARPDHPRLRRGIE